MANPSETKVDRLNKIVALLLAHPEGLKPAELARRLGVDRSTLTHYLPNLPRYLYIDEADQGRWKLDRTAELISICFNLQEATAVHLACRLLATQIDRQNPHAAAAVRKLAIALERLAPHVAHHMAQSADAMDDRAQRHDQAYLSSLETLTTAWAEGRKVRLSYRKSEADCCKEYVLSPYYLEPNAVGRSTYAIGFCDEAGDLRTFKVERIEALTLLDERYSLPAGFEPRELLSDAWGIWYTDGEPVEVVLKFRPRVARRVRETRWHRSEQVTVLADGGLLWRARIAATQEMLPWIRSWGMDVEVLEPESLREQVRGEVEKLFQNYGG